MRPIDADELVNVFPLDFHEDPTISMGRVRYIIRQMPTLHIRPVIHAHWEPDEPDDNNYWFCSNCGEDLAWFRSGNPSKIYKYCPTCGAKMRQEYEMDSDS